MHKQLLHIEQSYPRGVKTLTRNFHNFAKKNDLLRVD